MSARFRCCLAVGLVLGAPLACADDDQRRPVAVAGSRSGSASDSGGADDGPGGARASSGGAPAAGDGGASSGELDLGGSLAIGGAPVYDPALCDIAAIWGNAKPVMGVSTAADERLLGMTHDVLTVVFSRDDVLMVADREGAGDDFGAAVPVTLPQGYTFERGVALHPDGLGLVIVSALGERFADLTRAARSGDFTGALETERFQDLSENARQLGGGLSSPVLSASGRSLYFTQIGSTTSKVFRTQGTTRFAIPAMPEDLVTLGGNDGNFKLTRSVSADERTLFIFDEALGHAAGLWSAAPGAPFYELATFPGIDGVFTDSSCSQRYGTLDTGGSLDIVLETAE